MRSIGLVTALLAYVGLGISCAAAQEVHVIGVYQGTTPTSEGYKKAVDKLLNYCDSHPSSCPWGETWDKIHKRFPSRAEVTVTRTGAPITLVLSAYDRTVWNIKTAPGVKLERIILSGYEPQRLVRNAATKGVKVIQSTFEQRKGFGYFYFYGDDRNSPVGFAHFEGETPVCSESDVVEGLRNDSAFQHTLNVLARLKLTPTSIQSTYEAPAEGISIDASSNSTEIPEIREGGLCYRNPDGTLSVGGI